MDNETRQYSPQGEPPRRERPKQYFPDQSAAYYEQGYQQPAYEQPAYAPQYEQPYYEPEPEKGTSAGSMALGIIAALSFVAAVVLFFLWRGAAEEADKPAVTETKTVTQTTTEVQTKTQTTTKFPSIFRDREDPTATLPPEEPQPRETDIQREVRDIIDQIRGGADEFLQEQQQ